MPVLNEIKNGNEIGKKNRHKHIWAACTICGIPRWIALVHGKPASERCRQCYVKQNVGEKNPTWKGGSTIGWCGYKHVLIADDSPFYPMARKKKGKRNGYVLEHRLIMAQHIGRCLYPWEIVHHKNGVRTDNKLENLQLIGCRGEHNTHEREGNMFKREKEWLDFADEVRDHVVSYTIKQYGDMPEDQASSFTLEDFKRELQKYCNRMGSGVRGAEEQERDFKKIAHYACMGLARFRADRKK